MPPSFNTARNGVEGCNNFMICCCFDRYKNNCSSLCKPKVAKKTRLFCMLGLERQQKDNMCEIISRNPAFNKTDLTQLEYAQAFDLSRAT